MKSKELFFIRHGKLLLPYKNHNEMPFKVVADLASEKLNPSVDEEFILSEINKLSTTVLFECLERIYVSPSKRCQSTGDLISNFINKKFKKQIQVIIISELKEVDFNLNKLFSSDEKKNTNIEMINNRVLHAIIDGKNCEPFLGAYNRVDLVFKKIDKSKTSLLITHDFFMRVIEIYIKNKGLNSPSIAQDVLQNTKTNSYLSGFSTDSLLSYFLSF